MHNSLKLPLLEYAVTSRDEMKADEGGGDDGRHGDVDGVTVEVVFRPAVKGADLDVNIGATRDTNE